MVFFAYVYNKTNRTRSVHIRWVLYEFRYYEQNRKNNTVVSYFLGFHPIHLSIFHLQYNNTNSIWYTVWFDFDFRGYKTINGYSVLTSPNEMLTSHLQLSMYKAYVGLVGTKRPSHALVHRHSSCLFRLTYHSKNYGFTHSNWTSLHYVFTV